MLHLISEVGNRRGKYTEECSQRALRRNEDNIANNRLLSLRSLQEREKDGNVDVENYVE